MTEEEQQQPEENLPQIPKVRIGIRIKLVLLIFVSITIALGVIAWQGLDLFIADKENYVSSLNSQVATEIERQVAGTVSSLQQRMMAFADTLDYAYNNLGERSKAIKTRFSEFTGLSYLAVHYIEKDDTNFYFNAGALKKQGRTPDGVKTAFSASTVLKEMADDRLHVVNVTQKQNSPLVRIAVRTTTIPGNDVLVVGEMPQSRLISIGSAAEVYTAFLVDKTGHVLAHPDTALLASRVDLSGLRVVQALSESDLVGNVEYVDNSGETMLAAHAPVGDTGIGVVVQIPQREAFAATTLLAKRSLFVILVVGIISLFVAVFFAGTLARPVRKLAEAAARVAAGDFDQNVKVRTKDEIGALAETFNYMTVGLRERDRVKTAFGRYVSKQVAQKILSVEDELALEGESREISILFSDIRGFTSMSERLPAKVVVNILNAYFRQMVDCVFRNDGSLDKYMGDAIMAVYGAPLTLQEKEWKAVKTAIDMQTELKKLNAALKKRKTGLQLKIGIGINTGEVIAGNIGSPERLEYTVIGDNVNVGQRIEAATKPYDGGILISESTFVKVKDRITYEKLDPIEVKGKSKALQLYRVIGEAVYEEPEILEPEILDESDFVVVG